ncbi:MAG: hypothetical protein LBR80_14890 [Deltaproteobacteria bacterium]|jgi:hypothetical protein|nr:hypothetical protein [Deltaproteobacteria bacterium]
MRKAVAAATICLYATLIGMYCPSPVIFYGDQIMKRQMLACASPAVSGHMILLQSLLSVTDTSWDNKSNLGTIFGFQTGFVILVSYAAFDYFLARKGASWAFPFSVTAGLILVTVARPSIVLYPPLKYGDIAQLSYSFQSLLTLSGAFAGAVTLMAIFGMTQGFTPIARPVAALAAVTLSITFVVPNLYPETVMNQYVMNLDAYLVRSHPRLVYGGSAYFHSPPPVDSGELADQGRGS